MNLKWTRAVVERRVIVRERDSLRRLGKELSQITGMAIRSKYILKDAEVEDLPVFADAPLVAVYIVACFQNQQTEEFVDVERKCRAGSDK